MSARTFRVGEICVLRNDLGGRLFTVGEAPASGSAMVGERQLIEGQPIHYVRDNQLVRVENELAAVRLVAVLEYITRRKRAAIQLAEHQWKNECDDAVTRSAIWEPKL